MDYPGHNVALGHSESAEAITVIQEIMIDNLSTSYPYNYCTNDSNSDIHPVLWNNDPDNVNHPSMVLNDMHIVPDNEVEDDTGDDMNRALNTLPDSLSIKRSKMTKSGIGVFTDVLVHEHTRFGPYQGDIISETQHEPMNR